MDKGIVGEFVAFLGQNWLGHGLGPEVVGGLDRARGFVSFVGTSVSRFRPLLSVRRSNAALFKPRLERVEV